MPKDVADAEADLVAWLDAERLCCAHDVVVDAAIVADYVFGGDVCDGTVAVLGAAYVFVYASVFAI